MSRIVKLTEKHPEEMNANLYEFSNVIEGIQHVAGELEKEQLDSFKELIVLFGHAKQTAWFDLLR